MDKSKAISKIRKCLALAKSSNPGEAAAAMRQAQALMRQFEVSDAEIELAAVREERIRATSARPQVWEVYLAELVAKSLGCQVLNETERVWPSLRRECRFVFVGVEAHAEMAGYAFHVLQRQARQHRADYIATHTRGRKQAAKSAAGDAFAAAWVQQVSRLLTAYAGPEAAAAKAQAYVQQKYPALPEAKPGKRGLEGAGKAGGHHFLAGALAGRKAQLARGVDGAQHAGLIGAPAAEGA